MMATPGFECSGSADAVTKDTRRSTIPQSFGRYQLPRHDRADLFRGLPVVRLLAQMADRPGSYRRRLQAPGREFGSPTDGAATSLPRMSLDVAKARASGVGGGAHRGAPDMPELYRHSDHDGSPRCRGRPG